VEQGWQKSFEGIRDASGQDMNGPCEPVCARAVNDGVVAKPEIRYAAIVNVTFGKNVTVVQPVNLYDCVIGDGSFIGPFVEIQSHVSVGKRSRIQSHSGHSGAFAGATSRIGQMLGTMMAKPEKFCKQSG